LSRNARSVMTCLCITRLIALALACIAVTAAPTRADDFYKGKNFTIVVGFSPGGGFDLYARGLARHIGKHIPGNPSVIVQNQPGAGSLTSVRSLDVIAPKDGTVINIFNPGLVTQSIVLPDKVKLDFRNIAWVGVISPDTRVCYGFGPDGVKSWDDMMHRKEFVLGSTGKGAGNYINGATLRDVFHAPVKQVLGFPGSAEQRLAVERGELDGDCGSYNSIPLDWVEAGKVHPFVRFVAKRPSYIPESAVFINNFATTDEQKQLLDVLNAADNVGRPFIMSKQAPPDRLAIVRKAFNDTMTDPAFLADMDKMQLPVNAMTGEEAEAIVEKMVTAPPKILEEAKAIYE
jgi:tripartite-type tricarboxylate transporter receptor subunit TctC